jgi:antagonist of KipI
MSLNILKPGLLTTVQDTGRFGYRKDGIIVSGAMDNLALRIANLLVGNPESAATLEITLTGPEILFEADYLVALTGANLNPSINGEPVKMWRPVLIKKGSRLNFGKTATGCRTYLGVSGSFDIPKILGSYSTYLRAVIGGLHGKALQAGDSLAGNQPTALVEKLSKKLDKRAQATGFGEAPWTLTPFFYPELSRHPIIRAIKGPEFGWFAPDAQNSFWEEPFSVTPQSDRMGYRLQGPELLQLNTKELLSTGVTFGTVQVPAQGNPLVLMADHQTTGGYPRLAQVITADFSGLAQVRPGEFIRFKEISLPEAQHLLITQEKRIAQLKQLLRLKFNY